MSERETVIRSLGEVVLYVEDLPYMIRFYEDVLGLEVMTRFRAGRMVETDPCDAVFFRVAPGYGGHTQILGLFDRTIGPTNELSRRVKKPALNHDASQLSHIAFEIDIKDFEQERMRLEQHGLVVETVDRPHIYWRSLYVDDPEGNRIELVCYDENL